MSYHILKLFYNIYWKFIDSLWMFVFKKKRTNVLQNYYSIGIVTYVDRFEKFFKPLIQHLSFCFPNTEIVVVINGYYDANKQAQYLVDVKNFLCGFSNIKIVDFENPQSLSKLWNLAIINASNDKIIILNDDIRIAPWFHKEIAKSDILNEEVALINRSWSHFLISKKIFKEIGYFDQRFPGVGNEDEDYECRLVMNNIYIKSFRVSSINNVIFLTKDFSYGTAVPVINGKYVKANKQFFDTKWETESKAKDGFKYVKILDLFVKLKTGMETPNFYS